MGALTDDPLSKLKVNTDELDRKRLAELLDGFCVISEDGQIRPVANFSLLDSTSKVLAIILAQKAAKAMGLSNTDKISSGLIESISGLGSTARVKLMELRQQRVIDSIKGNYSIPNHSIIHVTLNVVQQQKNRNVMIKKRSHGAKTAPPDSEELIKLFKINQEQIGEKRLDLLLSSGKYLERALAVLSIGREIGIEALTPTDITRFLKEKIRANIIRENISLALGRGTKYVDRFPSNRKGVYSYRIMAAGDKLLENILNQIESKKEYV